MVLLLMKILWPVLRLFVRRVEGKLPKGQYILAANHASFGDPALLISMVAWKQDKKLRMFATNDPRWDKAFWRWWWKYTGAIKINGSLEKGLTAAKQGDLIGIFPEGRRSADGRIHDTEHKGVGVIALKTGLPVVPVYLNTFWWWNKYRKIPSLKRNVIVRIGKPRKYKGKYSDARAKKVTQEVMEEIGRLKNA